MVWRRSLPAGHGSGSGAASRQQKCGPGHCSWPPLPPLPSLPLLQRPSQPLPPAPAPLPLVHLLLALLACQVLLLPLLPLHALPLVPLRQQLLQGLAPLLPLRQPSVRQLPGGCGCRQYRPPCCPLQAAKETREQQKRSGSEPSRRGVGSTTQVTARGSNTIATHTHTHTVVQASPHGQPHAIKATLLLTSLPHQL